MNTHKNFPGLEFVPVHKNFPGLEFVPGPVVILCNNQYVASTFVRWLKVNIRDCVAYEDFGAVLYPRDIEIAMKGIYQGSYPHFITTMNPFVFDCLHFKSKEDARLRFILLSDIGQFRNLTEDEARRFYAAYCEGIQHVSEILRTQGLW